MENIMHVISFMNVADPILEAASNEPEGSKSSTLQNGNETEMTPQKDAGSGEHEILFVKIVHLKYCVMPLIQIENVFY